MQTTQPTRRSPDRVNLHVDLHTSVTTAYAPDVAIGDHHLGDAYGADVGDAVESRAFLTCRAVGQGLTLVTLGLFRDHFFEVVQSAGPVDAEFAALVHSAGTWTAATPDQLVAFQSWLASKGQGALAMAMGSPDNGWVARSAGHFVAREVSDLGLTRDVDLNEGELELLVRRATAESDLQAWRTVLEVGRADLLSCVGLFLASRAQPLAS